MKNSKLGRSSRSQLARSLQPAIEAIEHRLLLSAGDLDPTFGSGGIVTLTPLTGLTLSVGGAAVQSDGKVLVSVENAQGSVPSGDISTPTSGEILRLLTDGLPDPSFGVDGSVALPAGDSVAQILVRPNGKIVLVGNILAQLNPDGSFDTTFAGGKGIETLPDPIAAQTTTLQPSGGIITDMVGGSPSDQIVRFNPDGSRDMSFGTNGLAVLPQLSSQFTPTVGGVTTDSTGRIVISVSEITPAGESSQNQQLYTAGFGAVRLLPNGKIDQSFGTAGLSIGDSSTDPLPEIEFDTEDILPGPIAVAPNGTIYQSGEFDEGFIDSELIGYSSNGSAKGVAIDNLSDITAIAVQPDNKPVIAAMPNGNGAEDDRLNAFTPPNPTILDPNFNNGFVGNVGGVSVGGFDNVGPTVYSELRSNPVDPFMPDVALASNGQIIITATQKIFRLQGDPTPTISGTVNNFSSSDGALPVTVYADLNNNGQLDPGEPQTSTGANGQYTLSDLPAGPLAIRQVLPAGVIQTSPSFNLGQHVVAGSTPFTGVDFQDTTTAGLPDPAFGSDGVVSITPQPNADLAVGGVAIQPNGEILFVVQNFIDQTNAAPQPLSNQIRRILTDGSPDTSFASNGIFTLPKGDYANQILVQPNGQIVFAGNVLGRLNANGTLDTTFAAGKGIESLTNPAATNGSGLQPNGGIIIDEENFATGANQILRFNPNGSQDKSFGQGGVAQLPSNSSQLRIPFIGGIITDSAGRILISVSVEEPSGSPGELLRTTYGIVRLLPNGNPDTNFGIAGLSLNEPSSITDVPVDFDSDIPGPIAIAPDGTIYQAGDRFITGISTDFWAYSANGQSFGGMSDLPFVTAISVEPDGKPILVTDFQSSGELVVNRLDALNSPQGIIIDPAFNSDQQFLINLGEDASSVPLRFSGAASTAEFLFDAAMQANGELVIAGGQGIVELQNDATPSVFGTIFNDTNGNGAPTPGQAGIPGVTVYADLNNNGKLDPGEPETSTGANGQFTLAGLPTGPVIIRQILPAGNRQTSPSSNLGQHVTAGTIPVTNVNFQDTAKTFISGTVFNDTNKNGKQDPTESGLSGWTIYADLNNDGKFESNEPSKTVGANGSYSFLALNAGSYIFRVIPPPGWTQTFPTNNLGQHVTLTSGGSANSVNFGFAQTAVAASISGEVFNDANGNGIQNPGELGLSGWTVFIDLTNSGTLQSNDPTTTTDASGDFTFTNLPAGAYIVRVFAPTGWSQTFPTKNFGQHITLATGQKVNAVLFGEKKL